MVWIHGGRFTQGTARESFYSPVYMMDQGDIVVVAIQYRLGVMGWLSTGDSVIPGNFGYHEPRALVLAIQVSAIHAKLCNTCIGISIGNPN